MPPSSTSQTTPASRWTVSRPIRWNTCSSRWIRTACPPPWTGTSGKDISEKSIHTKEEWIEYAIPLSKLKEGFQQEGFCLSHFSYLVNLCHVTRVERNAFQMDDLQSPTVLIATVTLPHTLSVEAMIGQVDFLLWMAR